MFSLYRTLSVRYLTRRWVRTLLVIASIALGVAMLVATQALNQSIARAGQGAMNPLAAGAALQISNDDAGVHKDVLDLVRQTSVPGVRLYSPLVLGRVALPELNNRVATLIGVDTETVVTPDSPWQITARDEYDLVRDGIVLAQNILRTRVYVGAELAKDLSSGPVRLRIRAAGQEHVVLKLGTVEAKGAAAILSGTVLYPINGYKEAAKLLGKPDYVTRIDVHLQPDADREEVRSRLAAAVGTRAKVQRSDVGDSAYRDVLAGLEVGFKLGGVIALVVGLFLVYNALAVSVAERRHDIGILRSMGATRFQVGRLFLTEAILLGLAGGVVGIPLGWWLACLALGPIQHAISDVFIPVNAGAVEISLTLILAAGAAGVATAAAAALVPAIMASSEEPADVVRRAPRAPGWIFFALQLGASALLLTTGGVFMAERERLPQRVGTYGGVLLVLVGTLVSAPLLSALVARLISPLFRHFLGLEGRLAADNLVRSPGRTGLVIAAVSAVVALVLQTAGLIVSSESAILQWVDESMVADVFVTSNSPLTSSGQGLPMPAALGEQIAALPGVEAALPQRFLKCQFRDKLIYLIALDAAGFHQTDRSRTAVPWLDLYPRLAEPGKVLVSENFSLLHGVRIGDSIPLQGPRGPMDFEVIGYVVDYSWNRGTVFMDRGQYSRVFEDDLVDAFYVYLRKGAAAADAVKVQEAVSTRWDTEQGLVALTRAELHEQVRNLIRRLYSIAYAQEFVIGAVAALGVVTALLISVLQRRRELGLLRAVGATQPQLVRSVLAEAVLMGAIGALLGLMLGLPLEWYVVRVVLLEDAGFSFPVVIPWVGSALVVGLALVIAILAGLGPALHAMHLRIAEAIAYE